MWRRGRESNPDHEFSLTQRLDLTSGRKGLHERRLPTLFVPLEFLADR